jgi:hypothetical protein
LPCPALYKKTVLFHRIGRFFRFIKHFSRFGTYINEKHYITKTIYHEFNIVYRSGCPHYRMGAWRICLFGGGFNTYPAGYRDHCPYPGGDQKADDIIDFNKIKEAA